MDATSARPIPAAGAASKGAQGWLRPYLEWCRGPDHRAQHDLDARHQCCQACRKVTRAHKMVMVKEYSTGKGESTRSSESTQALPATCPSIVGVCARLVSKVQAYHFITCYCRREDCPRGAIPDHAGHRSARALAVRPLQAPRVWSWRKDCRQWRRRSATSGSEKSAGLVVGEALRTPRGVHAGLRVKAKMKGEALRRAE